MRQRCEVCANFRPQGDINPARKLVSVSFGARQVLLCAGHAQIAENSGVRSLEELRELYRESEGLRSYVPRRSHASDPERKPGRRVGDAP